MADTRTPVRGRSILRLSAQTSPSTSPAVPVSPAKYAPAFRVRLARRLANRAALKRQSVATSPEAQAERAARLAERLAPAAAFLASSLVRFSHYHPTAHSALMSVWGEGALDRALQALRAADSRQAAKLLNQALAQLREPLDTSAPHAAQIQAERLAVALAIRATRLMMANPDLLSQHFPEVVATHATEWAVAA
jgi:hypothetical protein